METLTLEILPGCNRRGALRKRLRILTLILSALFFFSFMRIASIAARSESWSADAAGAAAMKELAMPAMRGRVLDRDSEVLASTPESWQLLAVPRRVRRLNYYARSLAPVLNLPEEKISSILSQKKEVILIKARLPGALADRLREMSLDGLFVRRDRRSRVMSPQGQGWRALLERVEKRYETALSGRDGTIFYIPDTGRRDAPGRDFLVKPPIDGADALLTMRVAVDRELRKTVGRVVGASGAAGITLVAMDSGTGEILVNSSSEATGRGAFGLFTLYRAAGLLEDFRLATRMEQGKSTSIRSAFEQEKEKLISDTFRLDPAPVLEASARRDARLPAGILCALGFGRPTGVDIPGEPEGVLPDCDREERDVNMAEIVATPLQVTSAYCQLVNGGRKVRPCVLLRTSGAKSRNGADHPAGGVQKSLAGAFLKVLAERRKAEFPELQGYTYGGSAVTCFTMTGNEPCTAFLGAVNLHQNPYVILAVLDGVRGAAGERAAGELFASTAKEILRAEKVIPDLTRMSEEFVNTTLIKELKP